MSDKNRVVWSEGLFLRPQHFQQQDRYLESFVEGRTSRLRSNPWGFTELELDNDLLGIGKLAVRRARGVFPDGTPFAAPDNDAAPVSLDVGLQVRDEIAYLALPLRQAGSTLVDRAPGSQGVSRYRAQVTEARDVSSDAGSSAELDTAGLSLRLTLQSESDQDFARIPLAHITECRADKQVVLDDKFIPTVLIAGAAARLATYLSEIQGLAYQMAESLATRAVASSGGGTAEIVEYLMLQTINRYEPWVTHLAATATCHPEDLYQLILQMAGELSTFATKSRRPPKFPAYRHDALQQSFEPAMAALRACFAINPGGSVVSVPLVLKKYGIRVGTVGDKTLFDTAVFVIAVRADVATDELRRNFLSQCTIAPVEVIGERVNNHMGGVGLRAMPVAPRQLHNIAGSHYFEMERGSELWRNLKTSGGIALHLAGEFPGLVLECWAIRG